MVLIVIKIFFIAFFINLLYEILHSVLYETCIKAPIKKYVYLMIKGAVFDGVLITIIYLISFFAFRSRNLFENPLQLLFFALICLVFAYFWEIYSIKSGKWRYSKKMPLVFKAGLTPVIQLALTGLLVLHFTLNFS